MVFQKEEDNFKIRCMKINHYLNLIRYLNKGKTEVLLIISWLVAFVVNLVTFVYYYAIIVSEITT